MSRKNARAVVRAILERKYRDLCPPEYVDKVVESFRDDPVRVRPHRYLKGEQQDNGKRPPDVRPVIAMVVNDKHDIHHIRDRGYVEAPARVPAILTELERSGMFRTLPPRDFGERHIRAVHESGFVDYLKRACLTVAAGKSVYPYVFPIRNQARPPKELTVRAGYYCIDTFTPLNRNAYPAAKRAVDCTLTAADELLRGERMAYAWCARPATMRAPIIRRVLLLRQLGDRRQLPGRTRAGGDPGHRLPPRQRAGRHLL